MLSAYMVLSFYNFHERSEFTSTLTSTLTSETSVIMNSTFACFTSLKQSCFLTSEKSIYHQWEINLSPVRNQFITSEKKGRDVWQLDGTLFMHRANSRDLIQNLPQICHIYHNLQQICHTYIHLYIITIMHFCGRLADFSGKNLCVRVRAKHLCETWIMNCFTTTDWTDQCNLQFDNLQFTIYLTWIRRKIIIGN